MQILSRPPAHLRHAEMLEDVERLEHDRTAGARRTHRDDLVAVERAANRRSLLRLIGGEISLRDQATVGLHLRGDAIRDPAGVERVGSFRRDRIERTTEIGEANRVAFGPASAAW